MGSGKELGFAGNGGPMSRRILESKRTTRRPQRPAPAARSREGIDLRECKTEARRLLPPGHPVRVLLEGEPDVLEGPAAAGRIELLLRVILAHRVRLAR
jgi:hypothetical protein